MVKRPTAVRSTRRARTIIVARAAGRAAPPSCATRARVVRRAAGGSPTAMVRAWTSRLRPKTAARAAACALVPPTAARHAPRRRAGSCAATATTRAAPNAFPARAR
jgi:hypothetical protein